MKILVTGGTGFLGARLISKLSAAGNEVFALVRTEKAFTELKSKGAVPILGDLETVAVMNLPEIEAVVHAAAYFRFTGSKERFFKSNVAGTGALLRAAHKAGAKTFVHISAAGVIMDDKGSSIRKAIETAPTYPNSFSGYLASKASAEAIVLSANRTDFRTIALRPPAIWGPGDLFSKELPEAIASKRFAFIDRGNYLFSTSHVDNVVEAIECALERGDGGRAYFVQDRETKTFREFIDMIASSHGASIARVRSIPYRMAFATGHLMEIFAKWTRRDEDPPLSRSLVRMIGREFTIDDSAARRELGYIGTTSHQAGRQMYMEGSRGQGLPAT